MTFESIDDPARLRQLLGAVLSVGTDLSLPHVLKRIVEAGVELVDAQYGALGVLDEAGHGLSEFINVGMPDGSVERIGLRPQADPRLRAHRRHSPSGRRREPPRPQGDGPGAGASASAFS